MRAWPLLRHVANAVSLLLAAGCSGQLDAGGDVLRGPLPVDGRSATVVINDGAMDNWQGEYAVLLAGTGQLNMVGLIVNSNAEYPSVDTNVTGFRQMVSAARNSGLEHLTDPTASIATALVRPDSGVIEDTVPNRSEGARLILQAALEHGTAAHPLAIATGGAVTDVADAYLMDPTLAKRAVVVASLGATDGTGARTNDPNGGRDPWATFIVASRVPYVQVNGYYDQLLDVPDERATELPQNPFGRWLANKRSNILGKLVACDQVSVMSVAWPWFPSGVTHMRVVDAEPTRLASDAAGPIWHVAQSDSERARDEFWTLLKAPTTFH